MINSKNEFIMLSFLKLSLFNYMQGFLGNIMTYQCDNPVKRWNLLITLWARSLGLA